MSQNNTLRRVLFAIVWTIKNNLMEMSYTVVLNMYKTLKKILAQAEHILDTFEYFWVNHKSKIFCKCLATKWRHHHFCWKMEFKAEIFFGEFFKGKNDF